MAVSVMVHNMGARDLTVSDDPGAIEQLLIELCGQPVSRNGTVKFEA